jgi:putative transferase (TIGR04331 family)
LAHNLPVSLLEGFEVLQDYTNSQFPTHTHTVASGMAWVGDDGFLLWAAETKERGGRLISLQHGGSYGIREMLSGAELVEAQIADKVLAWGDRIQVGKRTESLPVLPRFFVRRGSSQGDRLLYLGGSAGLIFRYGYMSCVDSNDAINYIDRQCAFFAALPDDVRDRFLVRLHPLGFGWEEKERIRLSFPNLRFDDHSVALTQRFTEARLAVADNMNTSFLQAMGSGVPTILVWDREIWSLNRVGAADFKRLQDVGVFVDSPQAAAEIVRNRAEDAFDWWNSEPVASAVQEFLRGHFRTDGNWLEPWRKHLLD